MPNHRKPKQLKIIQGTFREDRNPKNEADPPKFFEPPKPPSHLGRYGKKIWKQIVKDLTDVGLLTVLDKQALEILCEQYDQYRQAHDAVYRYRDEEGRLRRRTLGEYLAGRNSQTVPEYQAMNRHFDSFRKLLTEFGMTPASRNRIEIPKAEEKKDPMEALLEDEV
jgi:P27 family predicted phage terminase small subunit